MSSAKLKSASAVYPVGLKLSIPPFLILRRQGRIDSSGRHLLLVAPGVLKRKMPKRKRLEIYTAEDRLEESLDRSVRSQRQQLETFIEYGKKNLSRALKVARGFERQKLGRRQKTAKEKPDHAEMARLEAEVAALKVRWAYVPHMDMLIDLGS